MSEFIEIGENEVRKSDVSNVTIEMTPFGKFLPVIAISIFLIFIYNSYVIYNFEQLYLINPISSIVVLLISWIYIKNNEYRVSLSLKNGKYVKSPKSSFENANLIKGNIVKEHLNG